MKSKTPVEENKIFKVDIAPKIRPEGITPTINKSGHLVDQMLKYNYPPENSPQLTIFDTLNEPTKKSIKEAGIKEIDTIIEGIDLTPSEHKLVNSLAILLHKKSNETFDPGKKDYYAGNVSDLIEEDYFPGEKTIISQLAVTPYELAKEYKGGTTPTGKDVNNINTIILELSKKNFLIKYKETSFDKKNYKKVRELELYQPIITLPKYTETITNPEETETKRTETLLILLHPIYRSQIESKFLTEPEDIIRRLIKANGSEKISGATYRLKEWLNKERSYKHYTPEINLDKLYYLIDEKHMRENRKLYVKNYLDKAIEVCKNIGLLIDYKEEISKTTGKPKIIFSLNKDWV